MLPLPPYSQGPTLPKALPHAPQAGTEQRGARLSPVPAAPQVGQSCGTRALAWTLTLLRCFHSSAHSRSVSLWSITSSGRDPWTTAGGEWTLRPHPVLPGPYPTFPQAPSYARPSIGCAHLGKMGKVKKRTRGTDPLPTVLRGSGIGLASTQGLRVKDPCPQSLLWLWPPFPYLPTSKSHCSHSFCPLLPTKPDSDFTSGVSPLLRESTAWLQPSFTRSSQPAGRLCIRQSPGYEPFLLSSSGPSEFLKFRVSQVIW